MSSIDFIKVFITILSCSWLVVSQDVPIIPQFDVVSIDYILKKYPMITYEKCHEVTPFKLNPFLFTNWSAWQPHQGFYDETFVLTIPRGRVCSMFGFVVIDEQYIPRELTVQNYRFFHNLNLMNEVQFVNLRKVSGRVAVVTRRDADCYGHWLIDLLGRLAILEIMGVEYDWLYIPNFKPYMQETLHLWGIDPVKIIEPFGPFHYIQADELIVPSLVARRTPQPSAPCCDYAPLTVYYPSWVVEYVRNKFLPIAQPYMHDYRFSKKVFISRKDGSSRLITNEDAVFALLQAQGFVRYELSKLSFLQQVILFHNAEIIISSNGSGLANIIFCKEDTRVIELLQARPDSSFYNLSQAVGLRHTCVVTTQFEEEAWFNTEIPLWIIEDVIKSL